MKNRGYLLVLKRNCFFSLLLVLKIWKKMENLEKTKKNYQMTRKTTNNYQITKKKTNFFAKRIQTYSNWGSARDAGIDNLGTASASTFLVIIIDIHDKGFLGVEQTLPGQAGWNDVLVRIHLASLGRGSVFGHVAEWKVARILGSLDHSEFKILSQGYQQ